MDRGKPEYRAAKEVFMGESERAGQNHEPTPVDERTETEEVSGALLGRRQLFSTTSHLSGSRRSGSHLLGRAEEVFQPTIPHVVVHRLPAVPAINPPAAAICSRVPQDTGDLPCAALALLSLRPDNNHVASRRCLWMNQNAKVKKTNHNPLMNTLKRFRELCLRDVSCFSN